MGKKKRGVATVDDEEEGGRATKPWMERSYEPCCEAPSSRWAMMGRAGLEASRRCSGEALLRVNRRLAPPPTRLSSEQGPPISGLPCHANNASKVGPLCGALCSPPLAGPLSAPSAFLQQHSLNSVLRREEPPAMIAGVIAAPKEPGELALSAKKFRPLPMSSGPGVVR
jgi:hypothetical protein